MALSVYSYFLVSLLGRQWTDPMDSHSGPNDSTISQYYFRYIPFFTSLEFVFYVGWLKVAETLLNPFGEDDDDFDTNYLVDRNIQLCFLLIDQVGRFPPEPEKDKFWENSVPTELPYTIASLPFRMETPIAPLCKVNENDAPIYLNGQREKETGFLKKYPSLNSVVSSIKDAVFRQNSMS